MTFYYDEFTQPPISQKPKTPPPRRPVVGLPPPAPAAEKKPATSGEEQKKGAVAETVFKVTLPIRSIAEEAAARAKQVHLQSLRDKVHGKGASGPAKEAPKDKEVPTPAEDKPREEEATAAGATAADKDDVPASPPTASPSTEATAPGLQSPTSGAWRGSAATNDLLRTLQSPTSTSWKPTEVEPPLTIYQGARLSNASAEEIQAIEKAETIEEKPDEEDE